MPINILLPVDRLRVRLESPELIQALGNDLAQRLAQNAPVASGATSRALSHVGQPQRTATGWQIGVGNAQALGEPNAPITPSGQLRAFYSYLESTGVKVRYTDWFGLSRPNKEAYETFRRTIGGWDANTAFYAWIQNSRSHFLDRALDEFRQDAPDIIRGYLKSK